MAGPARSPWGWHRLDSSWADLIVARAGVGAGDLVVDVGAGTGALTAPLVAAGARVVAVELHRARAAVLRERFHGMPVTVVEADAADLRLPRRPFRVVANPPFAIVAPLVRRLLAPGSRLVRADLVMPRYVARQWRAAGAPGRGRWATTFALSSGPAIPRWALHPPPRTAVVTLVVVRRPR